MEESSHKYLKFNVELSWANLLIPIATIVALTFIFPSSVSFDYQYNKGSEWKYNDIVAPFDFPILKDETLYSSQVNDVLAGVRDVYVKDEKNTPTYADRFSDQLIGELSAVNTDLTVDTAVLRKEITKIYDRGVVNQSESKPIRLVTGQDIINTDIESLYATDEVIGYLQKFLADRKVTLSSSTWKALSSVVLNNVEFDEDLTQKFRAEAINKVPRASGLVQAGELIVAKGDILTESEITLIDSYKAAYQENVTSKGSKRVVFFGYLLLTTLLITALMLFISFHYRYLLEDWRKLLFIFIWPVFTAYLVYAVESADTLSTYMIPFCIVPLMIQNFYDDRLAFFVHVANILIASYLSIHGYYFIIVQLLAGVAIIQTNKDTRYLNSFFRLILILLATYILTFLGLEMIQSGSFKSINYSIGIWLTLSTILTLLAYPFIPLFEKLFGFVSSITLIELSDLNRPLLKQLSIEAPGTFQHSLQVANLSEAAAEKIGAKSLLVKVAALYHDIGKMINPDAFIENQGSHKNPHKYLNNFESAEIIIAHVTEGVKMAKKANLPRVLINFIKTHHGTTKVEYFYRNQLSQQPEIEVDESRFRYPGPKPKSKEQTILMLADSIEAGSKSLRSPTGQQIDELVDEIVNFKIEHNQLTNSQLSFKELVIVSDTFKSLLRSIYHVRIEYPEEPKSKAEPQQN